MASPSLQQSPVKRVTCTAPVNIAAIKYWGKRNEQLILPLNSSLSVTLHQSELRTKTTIALSTNFADDKIWINGKEDDINNVRIQRCLHEIRRLAAMQSSSPDNQLYMNSHVHICSENNFPTAAGLASSAAGYACLSELVLYQFNTIHLIMCVTHIKNSLWNVFDEVNYTKTLPFIMMSL
jgi:diphosphomevalonate decarboxylase